MENTDPKLSFPQRNWFLLCVLVAILSPLVVHWIQAGANKEKYQQATGASSKDTSYNVAAPATTAKPADSTATQGAGVSKP